MRLFSELFSKPFSVSELNSFVKEFLQGLAPQGIWVKGEILDLKISADRRYASLLLCEKAPGSNDVTAQVQVMCWGKELGMIQSKLRSFDRTLSFENGLCVQLLCVPDLWQKQGRFQLSAKDIDPAVTVGELHALRTKIFNEIQTLGLHEKNKKLELPLCPLNIALITSRGAAGYHDFISEISNSLYPFNVDFYHAAVQGEKTEKEVVAALKQISKKGYDCAVLIRGGGAGADLKWFDNKNICLAIANSPIPVFTGIGHEINLTAADMVANMNFKTPTACAVFLVEKAREYKARVDDVSEGILSACSDILKDSKEQLNDLLADLTSSSKQYLESQRQTIHETGKEIIAGANVQIATRKMMIDVLLENTAKGAAEFTAKERSVIYNIEEKVRIYDPKNTLKLGYSITKGKDGRTIRNIADMIIGDEIETRVMDGTFGSSVTIVCPDISPQTPGSPETTLTPNRSPEATLTPAWSPETTLTPNPSPRGRGE